MTATHLYQPFELFIGDPGHWQTRAHTYPFFEIVRIMDGKGMRHVNKHDYPYKKGGIFLFTPKDCRGFASSLPTRFCAIRFSAVFLEQYKSEAEKQKVVHWLEQLEMIFAHHNRAEQLLIKRDSDCKMIAALIDTMISEYNSKQTYYTENLQHLVTLILNIIARNVLPIQEVISDKQAAEPLINRLLAHIHRHIYEPRLLRIKNLAATFNLSENYVGEYFRSRTGESLSAYLTRYKQNLIEQRLLFSDYPLARIAEQFGFTDESHLNRYFKKQTGSTPAHYRRKNKRL